MLCELWELLWGFGSCSGNSGIGLGAPGAALESFGAGLIALGTALGALGVALEALGIALEPILSIITSALYGVRIFKSVRKRQETHLRAA